MQLKAASRMIFKDGGWDAAFGASLVAAVLAATVLVVVVSQRFTDSPAKAEAGVPNAPSSPAETIGSSSTAGAAASPSATSTSTATPTRASESFIRTEPDNRTGVAAPPVTSFGRSLTLIEDEDLRDAIADALGDNAEHFSVVVVRPSDGRAALLDPDRTFYAASLFKLAVLYEAGLRLSRGTLGLADRLYLSEDDIAEDLGTLQYVTLDEEGTVALGDALEAMVTFSDNSIAVALLHVFGGGNIDATLRGLGVQATSVNTVDLPTTAREMARVMDAILAGEGLDPATHALLLGMLSRQQIRDGIPHGLPEGVGSGNKTGTWDGATHDVAWVDAPSGAYVIAILSDTARDWRTISDVSAAVYASLAGP